MKVLIIEDEYGVAQNLYDLLLEINPRIEVLAIIESVKEAIQWLGVHPRPDLGFFDIKIADGDSFEIFTQVAIDFPIIFTTAFDEYALRAFKVNSVDYLLKPIDKESLELALKKYQSIYKKQTNQDLLLLIKEMQASQQKQYKKSLLVYLKDKIVPIPVAEIAYFYLANDFVYCLTHQQAKYRLDKPLDKIENEINPNQFFRANRQFLISRSAVKAAALYFNRKLKLEIRPAPQTEVLVSKSKAVTFKRWLEL